MKRLTALFVAAFMLVAFAGCKDKEGAPNKPTSAPVVNEEQEYALFINNMTVSKEQFSYYYTSAYNYYAQMELNYRQQGYSLGFDTEKAPDEVVSSQTDEDGNALTWDDIITEYAKLSAKNNFAFYAEATSAGYTLTAEDEEIVKNTLESLDKNAASVGMTTNEYIDKYIAKGFDREGVEKMLEIEAVAMAYEKLYIEKVHSQITEEQIDEKYKENPSIYCYADISYYRLALPETEQAVGESDREYEERYNEALTPVVDAANEIAEAATSLSAFEEAVESYGEGKLSDYDSVTYDMTKTTLSQDVADWIFSSERADGDVEVIETENSLFVVYIEKAGYTGISSDVRHCLIKFDSENPTEEEKQEKYEEAAALVAQLGENGITEERFIDVVTENSDDTASVPDGGLYENITIKSNYVENFKNWAIDPARKAGDCEIVETEYGYHIMYYVKCNGADWRETVRVALQAEAYDKAANELLGDDGKYQITVNDEIVAQVSKEVCDGLRNKSIDYAY